jgi:hypothetical protein
MISSSKSSSISGSKETRAAQREGITNSETIVSASSMQLPVHLVSNSLPSRNPQPSRALRENGSNISLPVVAPGPEETRKRNESPHPQEDSRGQSTVIRPHAVQVDRTASVQPFFKPSTSYPPPSSSSGRTATRPHAEPVNRTASSSVQPSIKPSTSYPPPFSSSERNATRPHAEPVNRTASVQPPAKPSTPTPPLDRPSASISPSSSPPAPALAEMTSNRMHPPRGMPSYESQAQSREALSELPHPPLVDRGNVHSDEQGRTRITRVHHEDRLQTRNIPLLQQSLLGRTIKSPLLYHRGRLYLLNPSLLRQISLLGRIIRSPLQHQTCHMCLLNILLRRQCRLLCRTRRTPLLHHPGRRYSKNMPPPRQTLLRILCPNQYLGRVHLR